MGYTATAAGLALAPVGLLAILLSPLVGKYVGRIDARLLATVAFVGFAGVLWLRSNFTPQSDLATILVPTVLQGAAMAFFFVPLNGIVLSGLGPERIAAASGLSNFARITAGAFGTSISTTLWDNRATLHHAHFVEGLAAGEPNLGDALGRLADAGLAPDQALAQLNRLVDQQAFTRAADDIFLGSAGLFLLLIGLIWLTKRPAAAGGAGSADAAGAH